MRKNHKIKIKVDKAKLELAEEKLDELKCILKQVLVSEEETIVKIYTVALCGGIEGYLGYCRTGITADCLEQNKVEFV